MIAINDLLSNADMANVAGGSYYCRPQPKCPWTPKYPKHGYGYGYPLAATSDTLQFSQKSSVAFAASNETNLFINRTSIPTGIGLAV
jgi:hypothetical protein